ncbi:GNAT family N-acetyltransferase [Pleurocapsales cyanobacterium LEGE 06147]|nr:GNAT family N-acetyltransferase [Pleurocapsales cyanobacterium LEGE 06147]
MRWIFSPLDKSFDKSAFDCGKPQLNDYLKKYAWQNQKKRYSITFVATFENSKEIAGYYCTSALSIEFANIPDSLNQKLPKYPASVMLIGQLAVDKKMQGKGLGKVLLMHVLSRAVRISSEMGIFAVRVDAMYEEARNFYLKYGFIPLKDAECSLILPIKTIIASRERI